MTFKKGNTYINTGRTRFKKGFTPWNKGRKWDKEMIEKMSNSHKGNIAHLGKSHSEKTRKRLSEISKLLWKNKDYIKKTTANHKGYHLTKEHKIKISNAHKKGLLKSPPVRKGSKSHLWKGGITPLRTQIRSLFEYKQWRNDVFLKDDYTCQFCKKHGVYLEADHIKPFYLILQENKITSILEALLCKDLWDINNGRALCVECHKKTDTYMGRSRWNFKTL